MTIICTSKIGPCVTSLTLSGETATTRASSSGVPETKSTTHRTLETAIPILQGLVKAFHENDPTRPVTQALFRPNVSHHYDNGLADLLDVVGQNYREQEILAAHAQRPSRKILGTENTHDRNQA